MSQRVQFQAFRQFCPQLPANGRYTVVQRNGRVPAPGDYFCQRAGHGLAACLPGVRQIHTGQRKIRGGHACRNRFQGPPVNAVGVELDAPDSGLPRLQCLGNVRGDDGGAGFPPFTVHSQPKGTVEPHQQRSAYVAVGAVGHQLPEYLPVILPQKHGALVALIAGWCFEGRCLHGVTQLCISLQAYLKQPCFSDSEAGAHRYGHLGHEVPVCPASPQARC